MTQFRVHGSLAEAFWNVGPENAGTSTFVQVSQSSQGSELVFDVSADWTGQGLIGRQVSDSHFKRGAFGFRSHINGTQRDATATGTFTGTCGTDTLTQATWSSLI